MSLSTPFSRCEIQTSQSEAALGLHSAGKTKHTFIVTKVELVAVIMPLSGDNRSDRREEGRESEQMKEAGTGDSLGKGRQLLSALAQRGTSLPGRLGLSL